MIQLENYNDIIDNDDEIDPITDIIDYLVRCAQISFKTYNNAIECSTSEKTQFAYELYKKSPISFLHQFGKYLVVEHLKYFENLLPHISNNRAELKKIIQELKHYHSDTAKHKRVKNRRFKALQNLINEGEYFSEKEMMYRNPLLYEQLVGQYMTDEEINERDGVDSENLTLLNMILQTVDRNEIRETTEKQRLSEENELLVHDSKSNTTTDTNLSAPKSSSFKWGEFEEPDTRTPFKPKVRKQIMINAPERRLLQQEFLQEMYNNFLEGKDFDVDYNKIDNNEQYDDLDQVTRDAEDKYFDSVTNEVDNLEEHMKLVEVYGKKIHENLNDVDPLDEFMEHINKKFEA